MNSVDNVIDTDEYEQHKEEKPIKDTTPPYIIIDDSDESDMDERSSEERKEVIDIADDQNDEDFVKRLVICNICKSIPEESEAVELPNCSHRFCKSCLSKYIKEIGLNHSDYKCACKDCDVIFELDRWLVSNRVLKEEELSENELFKLKQILPDETLYYCPNETCKCCFILEEGEIHNEITGETDNEGNVMNLESIQHRDRYRVRCIRCETNWCIKCKVIPYHLGKTCEEYDKYLKMRKCRYCKNILEDQESEIDICERSECKEKDDLCCKKILKCGHRCFGINKSKCLPCLMEGCVDHIDSSIESISEDFCNICWSESLCQSPCIELACGHIFHYDCIIERIKSRWTGNRISFKYLNCPLCDKIMNHERISDMIKDDLLLMNSIKEKAVEYLKIENMLEDKELTDPSSEYYNKPEEYGMKKFAFYLCEECKKPYYAGLAACGDGNVQQQQPPPQQQFPFRRHPGRKRYPKRPAIRNLPPPPPPPPPPSGRHLPLPPEMNIPQPLPLPPPVQNDYDYDYDYDEYEEESDDDDADIFGFNHHEQRIDMNMIIPDVKVDDNRKLCNKCRYKNSKIKPCDIHGFEYAVFKCRYCCNPSVWFCFGTTHFCEECHNIHNAIQNKPLNELPKCLGKGKCPSGGNHPQNGVEHYLGCSVCLANAAKM